jgi:hypothetical protein
MLRRRHHVLASLVLGIAVLAVVTAVMTVPASVLGSKVLAQTLTDPNPPARSTPPASAKARAAEAVKRCSAYGPGFVNVPGTDACVKVGGWVTIEGGTR